MHLISGVQHSYAWGSTDELRAMFRLPDTGEPLAEIWYGAHPLASSRVNGVPLDGFLSGRSDLLGDSASAFGNRLPFLMKALSCRHALSIQAHPSRSQAEEGWAAEEALGIPVTAPERVYRDDWPKPEIMVALTQFRSLAGFRSCLDTAELFDELGAGPEAQFIPATLRNNRDDSLKDLFLAFLQPNSVNAAALDGVLHAAETRSGLDGPLGEFSRLALELRITFPGDRGLLCALLLNQVTLEPGEALYIDAGTIHAHLSGTGVEVMASSDNVVRGGLTDKHVDIPELSRIGHFVASTPDVTRGSEVADGVFDYETHCAEFDVWRLELPEPPVMVPGQCFPRIVLVTNGTATLFGNGPPLALEPGMAAFLPAGASAHVTGEGQMFVASPGAPGQ